MRRKCFIILLYIFISLLIVGCKDSSVDNSSNLNGKKVLSKSEISEIENKYLDSNFIFEINSVSVITDAGVVLSGKVKKGSLALDDVVAYVDRYGNLKVADVAGFDKFGSNDKFANEGENCSILINVNGSEEISNSSILFSPNKSIIMISFDILDSEKNNYDDYLSKNNSINIFFNGKDYNAEVLHYSEKTYDWDRDTIEIKLGLSFSNDVDLNNLEEILLKDFNKKASVYKIKN